MEHYGVAADIVTVAKGIASGLPARGHRLRRRDLGQGHAGLHGRHLRRQRRRLRRRRGHHRRHRGRRHAGQRRPAGREAARRSGPASRRSTRASATCAARASWTPSRSSSPARKEPDAGHGQGLHRRVPTSATSSSWAPARSATACASCRPLNITDADLDVRVRRLRRGRRGGLRRLSIRARDVSLCLGGGAAPQGAAPPPRHSGARTSTRPNRPFAIDGSSPGSRRPPRRARPLRSRPMTTAAPPAQVRRRHEPVLDSNRHE